MRTLVAIPVFNEEPYVRSVLAHVLEYADDVLVVDDGSTDATPSLLASFPVDVIRHRRNMGYGRSLKDAFVWAASFGYDWVITMDCDEQHEPASIPRFIAEAERGGADIISGSRYIRDACDEPPADRRQINRMITQEINDRLDLSVTDAFCGFKAYRVPALDHLELSEDGYAQPMQLWVQAVATGLRIQEIPVKLIYNDLNRSFGGPLDDADYRLAYYRQVLHAELMRYASVLPTEAVEGIDDVQDDADGETSANGAAWILPARDES